MLDIQFGEGGKDSKLFVHDLASAYIKYATNSGLKSEILHDDEGHITIQFKGKNAGKLFQHESGKHCVQRVPPTETRGRKQTSMVCVAVLPIPPDGSMKEIPLEEVNITTQCGHGPGGQHQNKTESAVKVVHKPTGISVFINGRDQHSNKREALKILTIRVNELKNNNDKAVYGNLRKMQIDGGGRGNKIRTYNFVENRVVDHKLGTKTNQVKQVIDRGNFNLILNK